MPSIVSSNPRGVRVAGPLRALLAAGALLALFAPSPLAAASRELGPEPGLVMPISLKETASAPPRIVFEPDAVRASGFAPGADVLFHGVTRQHQEYFWRVVQTREVLSADAAGEARLEVAEGEVGPHAIWSVVDLATGDLALGTPEGSTAGEIPFPANGLGESEAGAWRVLRTRFERLEALYVRPGEGAWWLVAADGGSIDNDRREDSALSVRLEDARPLWGPEEPPRGLRPGDVVVAVSLDTLDYFAARLVTPGAGD